jgi:superfamily II DNA or RNA helicase
VLTTGVDWDVRCIILARPTKSEILYTQIIGRGLRTAHGKDHCLVLDHSDTTLRLGFVTDIHHDELDDGKPKLKKEPREKKEALPKECPKCAFLKPPKTRQCPVCGFIAEPVGEVDQMEGELAELRRDGSRRTSEYTMLEKQQFYSELIGYAQEYGYKQGWAYWTYKDKFGVAPANTMNTRPEAPSPSTRSWIRHRNIVKAKYKAKMAERRA